MDEEYQRVTSPEEMTITPEEQDVLDEAEEIQDAQQDQLETAFPTAKQESSLYSLFWKVLKRKDSTKVANLNNTEIGAFNINVREAQKIGMLGHLFHHPTFGNFWFDMAEIVNATSMARQGWFTELFVSQKKFATRSRKSSVPFKEKWRLFQKKTTSVDQ